MQLKQHTTPCASVNSLFTGGVCRGMLLCTLSLGLDLGIFPNGGLSTSLASGPFSYFSAPAVLGLLPPGLSGSVSDSLGRPPRFKPRHHPLGGISLDESEHTAIGGDEQIGFVSHPLRNKGAGACVIRLDVMRAFDAVVTKTSPLKLNEKTPFTFPLPSNTS
jgi:hypothetical protein